MEYNAFPIKNLIFIVKFFKLKIDKKINSPKNNLSENEWNFKYFFEVKSKNISIFQTRSI